jgi:hypothetical protein
MKAELGAAFGVQSGGERCLYGCLRVLGRSWVPLFFCFMIWWVIFGFLRSFFWCLYIKYTIILCGGMGGDFWRELRGRGGIRGEVSGARLPGEDSGGKDSGFRVGR